MELTAPQPAEQVQFSDDTALAVLAFSPDGRVLATAALNGGLALRATADFALQLAHLTAGGVRYTGLAFAPDSRQLVATSWDGSILLAQRQCGRVVGVAARPPPGAPLLPAIR